MEQDPKIKPATHPHPGFYGTVDYELDVIPGREVPEHFPDDADLLLAQQPATGTVLKDLRGPQSHYIWRGYGPAELANFDPKHIGRDRSYAIHEDPDATAWCGTPSARKRSKKV